jgi:hypothetical protein
MEESIEGLWARAKVIFNHRTLILTAAELREARREARPFVEQVAKTFIDALGDRVVHEEYRASHVTLQLGGWAPQLVLRYPRAPYDTKRTTRCRFDYFFIRLPTGDAKLELRFSLGEGGERADAWDVVVWGLFSWGTRKRIETKASPILRAIKEQLPEYQLEYRESAVPPPGSSAELGRSMSYVQFGSEVEDSVRMVARDLRRLLDAAQEFQGE